MLSILHLGLKIIFVLEHGVVYAGTDEDKDQRRDDRIGDTYLRLQPLGILGIALVDALKEFLAVFDIFRMGIDLIHQPIFFAMFFCRPIRNLFHKPDNILGVGGRHLHKVVLDLFHTVCGRLNNQLIKVFEMRIKICLCASARVGQRFDPRARQPVFSITLKALFHHFALACVVLLLGCSHVASLLYKYRPFGYD